MILSLAVIIFLLVEPKPITKSYSEYLEEDPTAKMGAIGEGWIGTIQDGVDHRMGTDWIIYYNGRVETYDLYTESGVVDKREYYLSTQETERIWDLLMLLEGYHLPDLVENTYLWTCVCYGENYHTFECMREDSPELEEILSILTK